MRQREYFVEKERKLQKGIKKNVISNRREKSSASNKSAVDLSRVYK